MFWSKKKDKDGDAEEKERILRELRGAFPSLRRPNNDDTVYELLFEINKQYNTLRIFFAPDFPTSRPALQVVGNVTHPWLDQYKRVIGCDKLNAWSKQSSLANIVQDTLAALDRPAPGGSGRTPYTSQLQSGPSQQRGSEGGDGYVMVSARGSEGRGSEGTGSFGGANAAQPPGYNSYGSTGGYLQQAPQFQHQQQQQQQQHQPSQYQQQHYQPPHHPHHPHNQQQYSPPHQYQQHQHQQQLQQQHPVAPQQQQIPAGGTSMASFYMQQAQQGGMQHQTGQHQHYQQQLYPPYGANGNRTSAGSEQPPPAYDEHNPPRPAVAAGRPESTPIARCCSERRATVPDVPSSFPELQEMTDLQLARLLDDEVALKAHVMAMPLVASTEGLKDDLKASNAAEAAKLCDRKAELEVLQSSVSALQDNLRDEMVKFRERAAAMGAKYAVERALVLKKAEEDCEQRDEVTEAIAEKFTEGKPGEEGSIDLSSFLATYPEKRAAFHEASLKLQLASQQA